MNTRTFDHLIERLRLVAAALPDRRTGANTRYTMADIALAAFAVFFTQSPSCLDFQRRMEQNHGGNNAGSLFQIQRLASDNHIRQRLDPIEPCQLFGFFDDLHQAFDQTGLLEAMRAVPQTRLIALEATCEINVAKRWLGAHAARYHTGNDTLLGDDLYAHQPFCRQVLLHDFHFLFTCKPASHPHLSQWVEALEPGRDRGYHLEHNFGHGKQHPSSLLATMNLLAFALHTFLELGDASYRLIRAKLGARRTFFQDLPSLTTYLRFPSWERLLDFMMRGLEIGPYAAQKS